MTKKEPKNEEVRTRMAPSPTGLLHIGSARTALFNYLFAKRHEGAFVLRIEDTDIERSKPEYETDIIEGLKWLGIKWDEGPDIGGKYGPYRQSERLEIYRKYLNRLFEENKAYYCFCSEEELETERQYQMSIGQQPHYSGKCLKLTKTEVEENLKQGKPAVVRFKIQQRKVAFEDLIRGKIEFDTALVGDIVIAKDLNTPLYNFAVVIDDYEMTITHVIRGEEHISNTPKQILIQEALGLPKVKYAHLPLILGTDRSKLSKRHGATSVLEYRNQGYLPEALVNFIAFLGWNPGDENEIYTLPYLVKEFSLERIQKGGAIFNIVRLDWLNGYYARKKSLDKLTELCIPFLTKEGFIIPIWAQKELIVGIGGSPQVTGYKIAETGDDVSWDNLKKIIAIEQERIKKLSDITELTDFFFKKKLVYDKNLLIWGDMTEKEVEQALDKTEVMLSLIDSDDWSKEMLEKKLMPIAENFSSEIKKEKINRGYILWPLRAAITGKKASAGPFEIAEILGKDKTLKRIREAKELLENK